MEVEEAVAPARMETSARGEPAIVADSARPIILAVILFAALSSYCAIRSQGFISGDACIHYFSARYAFAHPENFVDVWSRPLVTALYAGPAWIGGREAIRIVSMLVAIGCGLVGWRIARGQGLKWPALALVFTLGQPLLFLHSFSEMTELPFALLLGLAFVAWQEKRFWLAAILVSWTPLARPEGFGIVAMVGLGLIASRNWKQVLVLPVPVILWDVAGWLLSDHRGHWWRWLKDSWPYAGESLYGHGHILTFVALLPMIVSPLVLPAMIVGIWRSLVPSPPYSGKRVRVRGGSTKRATYENGPSPQPSPLSTGEREPENHLRLCVVLTAALPLFVLVAHSLLYWRGKMASSGEARYLIVVAPFWGVLAARGWEWVFARMRWRNVLPWATAAVLTPPILVNAIHPAVPVPFWHDWESARQIAAWYQSSPLHADHPKVATSHPGVYYFLEVNPYHSPQVQAWGKQTVHDRPADTVLIWDPIFGSKNACAELSLELDEIRRAGWVEVQAPILKEDGDISEQGKSRADDPESRWHVFIARSGDSSALSARQHQ